MSAVEGLTLCASCGTPVETVEVSAELVGLLRQLYHEEGVLIWLRGANGLLDRRPFELIAEGREQEVVDVVVRMLDGVFS